MRFCVAVPCFFKDYDFCDALRRIAELGYDAAETYEWKHLDLDAVKATMDETGVELLSMCTTEFRLTSPEHRKLWLDGLKESCIAAAKLGVHKLITQVGADTGAPRELQHRSIVEGLMAAGPILDEYDVTIMIEPLNLYVDHPSYYLWSSAEGFDIIREVGLPRVKLIYDIYHQQIMEGNIIRNVVNNLLYIEHLHSAGSDGRHELWLGESDYNYIFDAIDKAGYEGYCGLEYSPTLPYDESLKLAKEKYGE